MKKIKAVSILMLALQLFLCSVTAYAESDWGVRAALTWENSEGETIVNEELLQLAQGVHQVFSGDVLRVTVADALFDGRRLAVAWEIENLTEDQLVCLVASGTEDSAYRESGPYGWMSNSFLKPGEVWQDRLDCLIGGEIEGDTLHVGIRFSALAPVGFTPWENYEGRPFLEDSFRLEMNELSQKLYESRNELSDLSLLEEASRMVATGKFELLEELDVAFDLKVTDRLRSLLPNGEAVEKEYGDFTMRITRADYTKSTMEAVVQAVFTEEAVVKRYLVNSDFWFPITDEEGEMDWSGYSWMTYDAGIRDDGTWAIECLIRYQGFASLPETVTISPTISTMNLPAPPGSGNDSIEGITFPVPR